MHSVIEVLVPTGKLSSHTHIAESPCRCGTRFEVVLRGRQPRNEIMELKNGTGSLRSPDPGKLLGLTGPSNMDHIGRKCHVRR